jgi:hypothetical protein
MTDERTPEEVLWDLMRGALAARALAIVADLRVADALAEGPRPVEDVARDVGADADTLHRVLRALASDGVFAETESGVYANTPGSELLRGPGWSDFAHLFGGVFHRTAGGLDTTREQAFQRLFGRDVWSWLAAHPSERAAFDRAMATGKDRRAAQLAAVEWRDGETVVDVGGGNGALLVGLLQHHRDLRGIVVDLPDTVRDEEALGERIEFVAGSFFEHVPSGDTYLLFGILHDWDDEHATAILRTIRASAPARARVLIGDSVIAPGNEPSGAKWLDLLMLAFGGQERDEAQWRTLLETSGFEPVSIEDGLVEARSA